MTDQHDSSAVVDYRTLVPALTRYFTRMENLHGTAWSAGREAATLWERVLSDRTSAQLAELDELMHRGAEDTGTAWQEMQLFYPAWRQAHADK